MALSQKLFDAIVDGKAQLAQAIVEEELKAGADPMALISETMIPAMDEVGKLFQEEEYFVPELMLAGRAMKAAMEPLRPLLAAAGAKPAGVVVAGAVKGDLHDIGKNLVISMLEGAGFNVIDLGADVTPEKFVEAIREHRPQIVCLSALLTVTMPSMKSVGFFGIGIGLQRNWVGVASTSWNGALRIKPLSMRAYGRCTTEG